MGDEVQIDSRYVGPPYTGNGGYVSGLFGVRLGGPATVILRAPIPLDAPLRFVAVKDALELHAPEGRLIAEGRSAADEVFAAPPPRPPSLTEAEAAGPRFPGLERTFHPVCFTCGVNRSPDDGLRVFVGQVEGRPEGFVAGAWMARPGVLDAEGRLPEEVVWAALDCPGSVAWLVLGGHAGLLGTISGRIVRRPGAGEPLVISAWPVEKSGRKRLSGTALHTADGELLAETRQVWITFP